MRRLLAVAGVTSQRVPRLPCRGLLLWYPEARRASVCSVAGGPTPPRPYPLPSPPLPSLPSANEARAAAAGGGHRRPQPLGAVVHALPGAAGSASPARQAAHHPDERVGAQRSPAASQAAVPRRCQARRVSAARNGALGAALHRLGRRQLPAPASLPPGSDTQPLPLPCRPSPAETPLVLPNGTAYVASSVTGQLLRSSVQQPDRCAPACRQPLRRLCRRWTPSIARSHLCKPKTEPVALSKCATPAPCVH
mgnify:CR=1 FL=1